jgi:hypothetical protein
LFRETHLEESDLAAINCRNGGEFLRAVMETMAQRQGKSRFAECTPEHALYLRRIKETMPDASVMHVIRDGRDVALSLAKQAWVAPFAWDRGREIEVAALYWEWVVGQARESASMLGRDYVEVRFEPLVQRPQETLDAVGEFIGQALDFDLIRRVGIGSVTQPNTSFGDAASFDPVGRWKTAMPAQKLANVENLVGPTLQSLDYELASRQNMSQLLKRREMYRRYWDAKLFLKQKTSAGRLFASSDSSWV